MAINILYNHNSKTNMWNDQVSLQHCPNPKLKYDQYVIKETSSLPTLRRRLGSSVLVAAALAAVAAAALRIASHEVQHLAFTFLLVMEFHLSLSSSLLLHGSLCLRCTKHNGEKRWLWNSCFWFLLPSNCLHSVVKRADCCHWNGFLFFALLPG